MSRAFVLILLVVVATAAPAEALRAAPPAGLSANGRLVWNLEALLHDTFGSRQVYVNPVKSNEWPAPENFSPHFISAAVSNYWVFTFANARHSSFKIVYHPTKPPHASHGVTGGEGPIEVRGGYVACGHARWLFQAAGQGPANAALGCRR